MGNAAVPDNVEMPEEAVMNTLDMQTKAKVNKIHLAEMQQDARNRHLVRDMRSASIPASSNVRIQFVLLALVLVLLVAFFVAATPAM
jgi:hypothetical protein